MKTNFMTLALALFCTGPMAAQFTLTKLWHEPIAGDVRMIQEYDSTTAIPRTSGPNQQWNFFSLTQSTNAATSSQFVLPASVPASSLFAGTTLVEDMGNNEYQFYKSVSTGTPQFEMLGYYSSSPPATGVKFNNSLIKGIWPLSPGMTFTDSFTATNIGYPGSTSGSQTVTNSGSGTITLPGGNTYSNVIQIKSITSSTTSITILTIQATFVNITTEYSYYHPNQKFPLLTVSYDIFDDGTSVDTSVTINVNKNITVGLKEKEKTASFKLYPNPVKNILHIQSEGSTEIIKQIEIINSLGSVVMSSVCSADSAERNEVDLSALPAGVYLVSVHSDKQHQLYKLIKE